MSWLDMYTYPSSLPPVLRMPDTVRVTVRGSTFRPEAGVPDCTCAPFEDAPASRWLTVIVSPALTSIVEATCSPTRTWPVAAGQSPSTNQYGFMACTASRSAPPAT